MKKKMSLFLVFAVLFAFVLIVVVHLLVALIWWHLDYKSCLWAHVIWIVCSIAFGAPLGYHLLVQEEWPYRQPRFCITNHGHPDQKIYWIDMRHSFLGRLTYLPLVEFNSEKAAKKFGAAAVAGCWPWESIEFQRKKREDEQGL